MFAKLRSLFPALAAGLVGMSAADLAVRDSMHTAARQIDYSSPRFGRHSGTTSGRGPGISPAVRGPHSEPQVHVRSRNGTHYWFTQDEWDIARSAKVPFRPIAGDVIERVDGYGAVTKRTRVPL